MVNEGDGMPIIGFGFNLVNAKKTGVPSRQEIKINSTPKILDIKEINVPNMTKKALSFDFEFVTTYNPKIAEIKIGGNIIYIAKSNRAVLNEWKKKKTIPEEVSVEILNNLFRRCLLKISYIAEDLQLPPPLQFPKVRPKREEASYVG